MAKGTRVSCGALRMHSLMRHGRVARRQVSTVTRSLSFVDHTRVNTKMKILFVEWNSTLAADNGLLSVRRQTLIHSFTQIFVIGCQQQYNLCTRNAIPLAGSELQVQNAVTSDDGMAYSLFSLLQLVRDSQFYLKI